MLSLGGIFDVDRKERRLEEVNREMENPDLWNDPEHAQKISKEKKTLEDLCGSFKRLTENGERELARLLLVKRLLTDENAEAPSFPLAPEDCYAYALLFDLKDKTYNAHYFGPKVDAFHKF